MSNGSIITMKMFVDLMETSLLKRARCEAVIVCSTNVTIFQYRSAINDETHWSVEYYITDALYSELCEIRSWCFDFSRRPNLHGTFVPAHLSLSKSLRDSPRCIVKTQGRCYCYGRHMWGNTSISAIITIYHRWKSLSIIFICRDAKIRNNRQLLIHVH